MQGAERLLSRLPCAVGDRQRGGEPVTRALTRPNRTFCLVLGPTQVRQAQETCRVGKTHLRHRKSTAPATNLYG